MKNHTMGNEMLKIKVPGRSYCRLLALALLVSGCGGGGGAARPSRLCHPSWWRHQ